MRTALVTVLLMIIGCASSSVPISKTELHPKIIEQYYSEDSRKVIANDALSGEKVALQLPSCDDPKSCGELIKIDCGYSVDGALIFVDNVTGLEVCTTSIWCKLRNLDCKPCPPKEWLCK